MGENLQLLTEQLNNTIVPYDLMELYHDLRYRTKNRESWKVVSENRLWSELVFCILSANVSFELAKSVISVLHKKNYLDTAWLLSRKNASTVLYNELREPNFHPKKKDGSLRRYRYPRKAELIVKASQIIYRNGLTIKELLQNSASDFALRNQLANTVPGIGLKEASHFLRNVGYSDSLAIIDVHVFNFCKDFLFNDSPNSRLQPQKDYFLLERVLQNFTSYHKLNLAIFDLAIWFYMRQQSA